MAFSSFAITFTFLINLHGTRLTLWSRFRNPREYVAPAETMMLPQDVSDNVYKDLIEEVPDLPFVRRRFGSPFGKENRTVPQHLIYLRTQEPSLEAYYPEGDKEEEEEGATESEIFAETTIKPTETTTAIIVNLTSTEPESTRPPWFTGPHVATCYTCGLNASYVPQSALCDDAFTSNDFTIRTMTRFMRTKCYRNPKYTAQRIEDFYFRGRHYKYDPGLKRGLYGPYIGGCFKRYMDVGTVYTQRGCRAWWPTYAHASNFASHRYTRLESLLKREKNACVVSPHASLTPFSRTISLFVRYHVCVCEGRYCNSVDRSVCNSFLMLVMILYLVV